MRSLIAAVVSRLGFRFGRAVIPVDMEQDFLTLRASCAPFSMTSIERMYALWGAVRHLVLSRIEGDFVECGVWRGGSAMLMASTLLRHGETRTLWLYDTFAGMTEPSSADRDCAGVDAYSKWKAGARDGLSDWCRAELEVVRDNMRRTAYPESAIKFVVGPVEETLKSDVPDRIALLRLDTDWYASTRAELEVLYPRLAPGGVLIVDDYGHWQGARRAVDEYFARQDVVAPFLARLDYTGRLAIKP
jgi:O-methyltransferase